MEDSEILIQEYHMRYKVAKRSSFFFLTATQSCFFFKKKKKGNCWEASTGAAWIKLHFDSLEGLE